MKKFSIIIPTYNRSNTLPRAIKSLTSQEYKNWELIIVDDGSTDNTNVKIKGSLIDKRIKYYQYKKNQGVAYARNFGISKVSPQNNYIVLLDSDDELSPDALNIINKSTDKFPHNNVFYFSTKNQHGTPTSYVAKNSIIANLNDTISEKSFSGEFHVVCSHRIKDELRFDTSLVGFEGLLWYQLIKNHGVIVQQSVTRIYWQHQNSITGNNKKYSFDTKYYQNIKLGLIKFLHHYSDLLTLYNRRRYSMLLSILGRSQMITGEISTGLTTTINSLKQNPLEWRNIFNLIIIPILFVKKCQRFVSFH